MSRFYQLLTVLFLLCALTGAAAGVARAEGSVYPYGLHGPSDVTGAIYPGTDVGNCCWIGAQGTFRAAAPTGADILLVDIYIPKFAAPPNGQALRLRVGDSSEHVYGPYAAGEHELLVPLPRGDTGTIHVHVRASSTFVPRDIGLNLDPRHLSVLFRGISFMNAQTGVRFDRGPAPWLAPHVALALLTVAGAFILVITLKRPVFGIVALIITDPFLLAYDTHGTSITLPKIALLAVALALLPRLPRLLRERSWATVSVLCAAQLFFILTMVTASMHAAFHGAAIRETLKAVQYAATLLIAYCAFRLDPDEDAVRISLSGVTIAVTVLAFAQLYTGAMQSEMLAGHSVPRLAGPLEGPNQLAGFLGVIVPAMLAFAILRPSMPLERAAIALGAIACLMTLSRGGIGALAIAIAVLLALRYRAAWRPTVAYSTAALFMVLLSLAFGVFTGALHGRVERLFASNGADAFNGGLGSRIDLWHGAYALWRSHPLFGIGPGNFEFAIGRLDRGVRTHANSMFFQVLAEQGIAGFAALLAVITSSVLMYIRRLNHPLALAACIAAIALTFHQIVDCMWLYPKVGVLWWLVVAFGAAAVDLQTASDSVTETALA